MRSYRMIGEQGIIFWVKGYVWIITDYSISKVILLIALTASHPSLNPCIDFLITSRSYLNFWSLPCPPNLSALIPYCIPAYDFCPSTYNTLKLFKLFSLKWLFPLLLPPTPEPLSHNVSMMPSPLFSFMFSAKPTLFMKPLAQLPNYYIKF